VDGDGQPEIGVAGASRYVVFETDGSVKWSSATHDFSSNLTGSSVFDFDGDGRAEVIYADELYLHIYRGSDGAVLYQLPNPSGTLVEYPVIADVDADGNAEIVVVANNYAFPGVTGIRVIGDRNDGWVGTRQIWNQHTYHITNVNDDGTIPTVEANSWEVHNTYRLNAQPGQDPRLAPDLVPSYVRVVEAGPELTVTARVGNAGAMFVAAGVDVTFYDGDPRAGGVKLGTVRTTRRLDPGQFEDVSLTVPAVGLSEVWVAADDDGTGRGRVGECDEDNNLYPSGTGLPSTNRPPIFTSTPPLTGTEGVTYRYDADAADPDGDPIRYSLRVAPDGMTIDPDTGVITWTPPAAGSGPRRVQVIADDGKRGRAAQTFTIEVTDALNTPPAFTSTPVTAATSGSVYVYDANAADAEDDLLTFDLPVGPTGMTVQQYTGVVVWFPTPDQAGEHDVILRVRDGRGGVALQAFRVAVGRPNTAPVITSRPTGPAVVGVPYLYQVTAQDADDDPITFRLADGPAGMAVDPATGRLTWTPAADQVGTHHVAVAAADGRGGETTQFFDLPAVATAPNNPPAVTSRPRGSVRVGDPYLYAVVASDPDGDPLTYSLDEAPAGMAVDAAGRVTWVPAADQLGPHPVRVRVEDGRGGFVVQGFTVTVVTAETNRPPAITSVPPGAATVGRLYAYDLVGDDPDGDTLAWVLDAGPAGVSLDAERGTLRWTPTADQVGTRTLVVRAADGRGGWATQTFGVVVRAVNLPPAITSVPPTTAAVDVAYVYAVGASDPDGDPLTFALTTFPAGATIGADGVVRWTPAAGQVGGHDFAVRVEDGQGGWATQTFTVVVSATAANEPPVITSTPPFAATLGEPYVYDVTADDPEAQPLTFSLVLAPAGMTIDATTGRVTWTPAAGQEGLQTVVVLATDPGGAAGSQAYTVAVAAANGPPTITSDPVQLVTAGLPYRYDVRATDPDADPLTFTLETAPAGMTVDRLGRITWSPGVADVGVHRVVVTADDGRGAFATQTYDLAVLADTRAPRLDLRVSENPVDVGRSVTFLVLATDDVGVTGLSLTVDGAAVPLDGAGRATVVMGRLGEVPVVATARDAAGNVSVASGGLSVIDRGDMSPPEVDITAPAAGSRVTGPVDVVGTASDTNLLFYVLEAAPVGTGVFTELFRGDTSVTAGVLGTFDPSGLPNDTYVLRLSATDAGGNVSSIETTVDVAGDLKVGNFTLSFTDLTVPVSGLPVAVARTYDSLNAGTADEFGFGWRLEFRDTDLRTSLLPTGAEEFGYYAPFTDGTRVYVTLPGGRREGFTFRPELVSRFLALYRPAFEADPGVTTRLSVPDDDTLIFAADGSGYYTLAALAYNPADSLNFGGRYTLTTKDGLLYEVDAVTGDLLTLGDSNGNTLSFTDAAIESNRGPRVTFERDPGGRITAVADPAGNRVRYAYDAAGDLVSVTDREGNQTRFVYDLPGRPHYLTEVIDPLGRSGVRTEYDDRGRLVTLIDAAGKRVELAHDPANSLETVRDALGNPTIFEYDGRGNVVREVDALGGQTLRTYDGANNVLSETDPLGHTTSYTYDGDGNLLTETDPLGNVTRNTYVAHTPGLFDRVRGARPVSLLATTTDPLGNTTTNEYEGTNLVATTDAAGNTTRYTYDAAGNQTSVADPAGNVTTFEYDGRGNLVRQADALGHATTYTYDANGNQLTQTTVVGGRTLTTTTAYDAAGRVTAVTDAEGGITHTEYDALGRQAATADALGRRTEYRYDDRGQLVEVIFPDATPDTLADNPRTRTEYDDAGRTVARVDEAGRRTEYRYDELGRQTETIFPDATPATLDDNPRTRTEYDAAGRVTAQIDERGNRTEFAYDAAGRQTVVRDALRHETTTAYDDAGRTTSTTDPLGHATAFGYDALGRQVLTTYADGSTTATGYDDLGRVTSRTDQLSRVTRYEYDDLGRLTAVVDALDQRTEYGYDEAGNLVAQTDANGHATRYEYDGLGRRTATVLPLGQRSETLYDPAGQVVRTADFNGAVVTFEYDPRGRLAARHLPGATTSFAYTPTGRRSAVVDDRGVTAWAYDERDRLLARTDLDGTVIGYAYDPAGNRTAVTTPAGTTAYTFDALNRSETVTDPAGGVTRYFYDDAGRPVRTELPNGTVETREYDDLHRLVFLETTGPGGVISSYRYTLAATGRRDAVEEHDGRRVAYTYDALDRLTGEAITDPAAGDRTIGYAYDPVGNRLTRTDTAEDTTTYSYDANDRLLTETRGGVTTAYTYDANGNTLTKDAGPTDRAEYTWDAENRLVGAAVTDAAGTKAIVNRYDADGIRVAQVVDGVETRYLIDGVQAYPQVLLEYRPGGPVVVPYVYGNDLISQDRAGVRSYYHVDGLGSTRALTDAAGAVTDRYAYEAFGRTIGQAGTTPNLYLFAGEQRDAGLGLDYLRARYLSVGTGRFYGVDPAPSELRHPTTINRFAYALANPASRTDPSGRFSLAEAVATQAIIAIVSQMSLGSLLSIGGILGGKRDIEWNGVLVSATLESEPSPLAFTTMFVYAQSEQVQGVKWEAAWLLIGAGRSYSQQAWTVPSLTINLQDLVEQGAVPDVALGLMNGLNVAVSDITLYSPSVFGPTAGALAGGFFFSEFNFAPFVGFSVSSLSMGFGRADVTIEAAVGFDISLGLFAGVSVPLGPARRLP
jgi:RHS repeat-associated protein